MTVDDKKYLLNRNSLTESIQMILSEKQKTFSETSFVFLNSLLNLKNFPKKDDPHRWSIAGNTGSEKYAEINI